MVDGRVGREEQRLAWHLVRQKLKVVRQAPCGPYRIDVGIWPVAVEIHSSRSAPERFPKLMLRAQYLIEHGWSVLYLWLSPDSRFTTGPWGAPAHIAHYRRQVLAGTARPFRMSYYDGSPDDEGEVVDGRLVLGFAPELPQRWNYPLIYEQWCQLTTEAGQRRSRRVPAVPKRRRHRAMSTGTAALTVERPPRRRSSALRRAIVVGRGYYRRKIWM